MIHAGENKPNVGPTLSRPCLHGVLALLLLAEASFAASPAVIEIVSPARGGAAQPFLHATSDALFMSWLEPVPETGTVALRIARFASGRWSEARTITEGTNLFVNWADFPSVVADRRGVLFAHWLEKSGSDTYAYDVRLATSKDGGRTWSKPFLLNRDGRKTEHGFVTLTPLMGSGVGATWLDGRNMPEGKEEGEMTVRYATVDEDGDVRSDVQLDGRTCECCTTGMAMTTDGPVVVYRDRSSEEVRDIAVVRRAESGWTKPALVHADGWKIAGCPVNGPQVASSGRRIAVAWFTAAQDHQRVYVAFSDDAGRSFGKPIVVDDGMPVGRVDIVMLDSKTAIVSWIEQTTAGAEVRARLVGRNLSPTSSIKIAASSAARAAGFPRMARVGRDVYIAWTDQSANAKRVHIARVSF